MNNLVKRPIVRNGLLVLLILIYLLPLVMVKGAVDMFLKIEGVDGESTDDKHKDWIEVLSYQSGVSRPVTGSGSGRVSGPASFREVSVTKWIDKSSPILMLSVCDGRVFPKVEIDIRRAGLSNPSNETYLTYTLSDCLVTSVSSASSGGEPAPSESISLNFTKIEFSYEEASSAGVSLFKTNVMCTVE